MIEIQIFGTVNSGKSALLRFLKECLENKGLNVEIKQPIEQQLQEEQKFAFERSEELQNKCLESIKNTIYVSEHQIARSSIKELTENDIRELNSSQSNVINILEEAYNCLVCAAIADPTEIVSNTMKIIENGLSKLKHKL